MSYILEALKRADAERQRGGVPGLHAQTGSGVTAPQPEGTRGRPWLLAGAALLLLLLGGALAWSWRAGPAAPPAAVSTAPAAVATSAPAVVAVAPPAAAPVPPPVVAPQPLVGVSAPPPLPGPAAKLPPVPRTPAPSTAVLAAAAPRASAAAAAVAVAPATPASAATVPERLPQLGELPEALRREVGTLNPGGSIYAEQPTARMVILNGQVFREGDLLAANLRVEQIRPRSVVLSLRGQRFELAL